MKRAITRAAFVMATVLPLAACDSLGSDNSSFLLEQLIRAEATWADNGSPDYTMLATRRCDCGVDPVQVELTVVANEIVAATYVFDGADVDPGDWDQYPTITEMFALVRDAVNRKVPAIIVGYDQEFGYVNDLVINYDRTRFDDDVLYTVNSYTPPDAGT